MKKFLCFAAAILLLTLHGAAKTFPDADVVLLDDQETVTYQTDGTDERTDFCRYQILTYKGLKEMRTLEMHYNSTYGSLKVTQLELTKADGRTVKLDPAKLAKYHALVDTLSEAVPLWRMDCTKDPEAALISHRAMSEKGGALCTENV